MPFVQADIDALDAAYKVGAIRVRLADGRETEFRSVAEYQELRRAMATDIALAVGTPASRLVRMGHSSGITNPGGSSLLG